MPKNKVKKKGYIGVKHTTNPPTHSANPALSLLEIIHDQEWLDHVKANSEEGKAIIHAIVFLLTDDTNWTEDGLTLEDQDALHALMANNA